MQPRQLAASAVGAAPLVRRSFSCPCNTWLSATGQPSCRELCGWHEHGGESVRLPMDRAVTQIWLQVLETPREHWETQLANNEANCDNSKGVRVSTLHIHEINWRHTPSGLATMIDGRTRFPDDRRKHPAYGHPVLPGRSLRGSQGVESSTNLHPTREGAAAAAAANRAAAVAATEAESSDSSEDEDSTEWTGFRPGTGLATIEQTIELAKMGEKHGCGCSGNINWHTRECTFVGVVMSLGGFCRGCKRSFRWYSSPAAVSSDSDDEAKEDNTIRSPPGPFSGALNLYLNKLVPLALTTSPGIAEQKFTVMTALELSIPDKQRLYKLINGECANAVMETWGEEQATLKAAAVSEHDGKMLIGLDGSHTGSADGAGTLSTVNAVCQLQRKVTWSECSDEGTPGNREHKLGILLLKWVKENEIDCPAMIIDESSLQAVIKATVVRTAQLQLTDD